MSTDVASVTEEYLPRLKANLTDNVLDFWFPRCVDEEHGGFITSYDAEGEFAGNDDKMLVVQSRMVWLTARLFREGYGEEYREIAAHGFDFLIESMWDDANGGFYWECERDGTVKKPNKHLYGQSFALYGLSEYYRVTGDEQAGEYAHLFVDLLEEQAKDTEYGGFDEYFEADWTQITDGGTYLDGIEPDWSAKKDVDSSIDPTWKLMNTHLHLMEAFTTYYEAFDDAVGRERLHELLDINTNTVVRKDRGFCTDKYGPDWTPQLDDADHRIVSYGHDLENVWLVMAACDALGLSKHLFTDLFETLWEYSLEYGHDEDHGGFYFYGPFDEPASNRIKAWWVQAECMTSALKTYEQTGKEAYLDVFADTWDFIEEYHVDEEYGEWHSGVTENLEPVGRKGAIYKGAYHNGRALLECINALESL
jgi:mannobiose 2-epimerase